MLIFEQVVKTYARAGAAAASALDGVTFALGRGEFAFLTGPSGSGKSSVLKLAYLEERPTSGRVEVAGEDTGAMTDRELARRVPHLRRQLGVVFQDFRLLGDRTAEQNVAFALEVTGAPRASVRERANDALAGGEQQRVAIARALVNRPVLLLADEPTGNLDDRAAAGVFELLREIHAGGTAVLMATHYADLVARAGLRTIALERGRVARDGVPAPAPALA